MFAISKSAGFAPVHVLSRRIPGQLRKAGVLAGLSGVLIAGLLGTCGAASAQTATTTTLAVTSGGNPATTVASGSVVTLTAQVNAGATPLTVGQVNFCDATATYCTDIHLLGTAQLTSAGTATLKFRPGPGVHSYKAVFAQNGSGLTSASATQTLTVGPAPGPVYSDTTSMSANGPPGEYSLTATVVGMGGSASPTGNISFVDTSFGNTSLATVALGSATAGAGWLVSQTPATGSNPISEVIGDFNGDGIPDLAVLWSTGLSIGPYSVTILLGNGDGTFTTGTTVQPAGVQSSPTMIEGDFNGDGRADLTILSYNESSTSYVTALLGNGDGTFAAPQTSQVYDQGSVGGDGVAGALVAADFNGDGELDLAVVGDYLNNGGVTILLGNGDGTFTATGSNLDPSADFGLIATGDFNGDGIPDLIATNYFEYGSSPTIFLGKGDGTFTAASASFTLAYFPHSILIGDFNGDGVVDLAFSDLNGIEIALGKGDGTFQETTASPISVNSTIAGLALGDFNQDGKLDIVAIGNYNGFSQNVLLSGAGDGTFTWNSTILSTVQNSTLPFMAVVGDFNGDGAPDLATVAKNVDTASILLTEPTETATAAVSGVAPLGAGTHNVEASYPGDSNYPASVSSIFELTAGVAPPVISPGSGTITSAQSITITDATPGATIYYSAFGALTTNQFVQYTGPIPIEGSGSLQIQAYAMETGYQQSQSVTANYTLKFTDAAATPVISLASGNYADSQTVTISDVTPGAQIYYLTDGAYPSSYSNLYTGPITVSTSEILTAVALAPGYRASGYATAQYDIATSSSSFIYTIAGNQTPGYTGDGGPATFAELNGLQGIAVDNAGNVYIADGGDNVVREIAAGTGIITTIAGTGVAGHTGDNGPATSAALWSPTSLAVDAVGNLYIGETGDNVVRLVNAGTGTITTFAGNPTGSGSLGGPANNYELVSISGIALDYLGANLYIANGFNVVEVNTGSGVVSLPTGLTSYPGFGYLAGITVDPGNNIYVSDGAYSVVRKISPQGTITVFAGSLYGAFGGDGGPATSAGLNFPVGLSSDRAGNIYIADEFDCAIREVNTSGIINTIAGVFNDPYAVGGDGSPSNNVGLFYPLDIASDAAGNVYVADQGSGRVRKVTVPTAPPSTAAAVPVFSLSAGTYSGSQTLTMTDATPGAEIYVTLNGSTPTTVGQGYHGPIEITGTVTVQAIALAPGYLASAPVSATYTITTPPTEAISTVVGTGVDGFSSAGGPATSSQIGFPWSIALDSAGNLYVADTGDFVVWMVTAATGDISIVAGTGTQGTGTDGGPATESELFEPSGLAVDKLGNIYITDSTRVRMVAAQTGIITTVAGPGVPSSALGDGGPATYAYLGTASGLAIDNAGNLYIADTYQNRIRMVAAKTGIISTVAGGGTTGQLGDGGLATAAYLSSPTAVMFDSAGNLYIADQGNERIRKVDASTGFITTIAGNGTYGHAGDGGPATQAKIDLTQGIAVDVAGNVYFTDQTSTVREVSATTGIISTLAGDTYFGFGGDGGAATMAELSNPYGLAVDAFGSLYVADTGNSAVRKVAVQAPAPAPVFSPVGGTYVGAQTVIISDSVQGAVIYYTTDGSVPTTVSTLYSGSITVSAAETLQAIAVATGYAESAVSSAAYIINQPVTPNITWATPAAITYGTALSATQLDATSSVAGTFAYTPAAGAVLAAGSQTLSVTFTPTDAIDYTSATGSVTLAVNKATPAVTESPSASSITTAQPLTVTITVSAAGLGQIPTGSVSLSGGGYTSAATLSNGGATISIPAGSLAVGSDALALTYTPDSSSAADYTTATQSVTVTVTQAIGTAAATVTATPSATTITNNQSVTVKTTVSGGSGLATPTGLVTLTSGSYSSSQALSSGTATFNIAAGSLSSGLNTLTATYSGDATYAGTRGTTTITVSQVTVSIPAPSAVSPGGSTTATALFTAGSNYSGTMNLTCTLTTSPAGAQSLPTCSLNPASLTFTAGGSGTTTVTIGTTAASTSALARPHQRNLWGFGQGGALLAVVLVFFVPSRRRGWISMLLLILVIAGAGVIGCGGSGSKTTGTSTPATTAGNYTFTVTGTDTVNSKITVSSTVAVTVE